MQIASLTNSHFPQEPAKDTVLRQVGNLGALTISLLDPDPLRLLVSHLLEILNVNPNRSFQHGGSIQAADKAEAAAGQQEFV